MFIIIVCVFNRGNDIYRFLKENDLLMNFVWFCLVLLIFLFGVFCVFNYKVVLLCSEYEIVCSFKFDVWYKFLMVYNDEKGFVKFIVIWNGILLKGLLYNKEEFEFLVLKGEFFFFIK